MSDANAPGAEVHALKRLFRWATYIGFWWSLLSLAYSMRTPALAIEQLIEWAAILEWALTPILFLWSVVRDAFIFVTAPIYSVLPFEVPHHVRDAMSFGFFAGARVVPILVKMSPRSQLGMLAQFAWGVSLFFAISLGAPYLLASDRAQRWLALSEASGFAMPFLGAGLAGFLFWLVVDPFDFVSQAEMKARTREEES